MIGVYSSSTIEGWKFKKDDNGNNIGVIIGTHFNIHHQDKVISFFDLSEKEKEQWFKTNIK